VLRDRREQLGLEIRNVANQANVDRDIVVAAEESKRLPIKAYEKIARVLGLDERYLSYASEPRGNERVTVRLRTIGRDYPKITPSVVAALAEAAWVAMRQLELEEQLALRPTPHGLTHNPSYGDAHFPAYEWGYQLARQAREALNLGDEPIRSLRDLTEKQLGFPLIQSGLGTYVAGATLELRDRRAIVVNIDGKNRHAYVRRATVAHELGHLSSIRLRRSTRCASTSTTSSSSVRTIDRIALSNEPMRSRSSSWLPRTSRSSFTSRKARMGLALSCTTSV
jgi:hypothetical protein